MLAFTRSIATRGLLGYRAIHTSQLTCAAEKSPLFKLRQKTGLAYSLCREALNKHENNIEEAEAWLKAHAMAHGLQKANKVRDRSTREGLVCISVPKDNSFTTIVELNCETDFVAKNQLFKDLVLDITEQITASVDDSSSYKLPEQDVIVGLRPEGSLVKEIESQIVPMISKLGENIKLARATHLRPAEHKGSTKLFGQIHAQTANKMTDRHDMMAGRFGAVVALELSEEARTKGDDFIKLAGNRLCQHVIGFNPTYIELPANIKQQLEKIEQERRENEASMPVDGAQGLSDNEGAESSGRNRDDWPSILDQTLIMTDDLVVRDFCETNGLKITYFNRLECGIESW